MPSSTELLRAVLREDCASDAAAKALLAELAKRGVDPLDHCAGVLGLGRHAVLTRAAAWVGLPYLDHLPRIRGNTLDKSSRDRLGDVYVLRDRYGIEEALFVAAGFTQMLALRRHVLSGAMRGRLFIVDGQALRTELADAHAAMLTEQARSRLASLWPSASAHKALPFRARLAFAGLVMGLFALAVVLVTFRLPWLSVPLSAILLIPAGLRLAALWYAFTGQLRQPDRPVPDAQLPVYSVLIPLRDEANMVPQLVSAMKQIDYPREKLDIKFVVEAHSVATLDACRQATRNDTIFDVLAVPRTPPHTKPKALNYALPFVRGAYLAVYDAEDIPDPDQLRRAAARFAADKTVDCLQCELVIENAGENALTALFAGEYAGQFGLLLPTLAKFHLPLPLGGTSNHFRVRALHESGGWDPYNVTEDADLGIRLSRLGLRTGTLRSHTLEEAPLTIRDWLNQRTRWHKGWMQTMIVHNGRPGRFLRDIGWRGFVAVQAYIGTMIVATMLHSAFLVSLVLRLLLPDAGWPEGMLGSAYLAIFVIGYGSAVLLALVGLARIGRWRQLPAQALLPFYWLLHAVATLRAATELLTRPYFWSKTRHGATRQKRGLFRPRQDER